MQAVDSSRAIPKEGPMATGKTFYPTDHFFAPGYWINDPNGLVVIDGVYHLFYQHNPSGTQWGNMSWGHAISHDLLNWEHRPVALAQREFPERTESIFSGCCVLDTENVSGLGGSDQPALLAFYTSHYSTAPDSYGRQAQSMAFSLDLGNTWQFYGDKPLIHLHQENPQGYVADDFRDPKVFYHHATEYWIMVLVLALDRKVIFYRSRNLLDWEAMSTFTDPGDNPGDLWEVPDLVEVPVGDNGASRWVLLLSVNTEGAHREAGSTQHYFVGDFDGEQFILDQTATPPVRDGAHRGFNRLDWGRDFYAAVSFHNDADTRPLMLAWMNNWVYANDLPDHGFRGQMSLPRRLSLREHGDGHLRPCHEVIRTQRQEEQLRDLVPSHHLRSGEGLRLALPDATRRIDLEAQDWQRGKLTLTLHFGDQSLQLELDADQGSASLDRRALSAAELPSSFAAIDCADQLAFESDTELTLYLDQSSIEVLGKGGEWSISQLIFPRQPLQAMTVEHSQSMPISLSIKSLCPE